MTGLGYVDDHRFAVGRASSLASRGYGDEAIAFDLEQRGVGAEQIAAAVQALAPEAERARTFVARSSGPPEKLARALQAKGFSAETVESMIAVPDDSC